MQVIAAINPEIVKWICNYDNVLYIENNGLRWYLQVYFKILADKYIIIV